MATERKPEFDEQQSFIDSNDTLGMYLKEMMRVPLLTQEEEIELAKRIEKGRVAGEKMARLTTSNDRRAEYSADIKDSNEAYEHLIKANTRLVVAVAKKYVGRGVPFLDLIQDGNIGLIRASKKFDYHRGYKFSTYATWWIRQAVTRAIADQGRTIRIPVHMHDQINRTFRKQIELTQQLGRQPTNEELAEELEIEPERVEYIMRISFKPLSLQSLAGHDDKEKNTLGEFIEDESAEIPPKEVTQSLLRDDVQEMLSELPSREAKLLSLRFGLQGSAPHTLVEIGRKMGVTRERVRQIEVQARNRLKTSKKGKNLQEYLRD